MGDAFEGLELVKIHRAVSVIMLPRGPLSTVSSLYCDDQGILREGEEEQGDHLAPYSHVQEWSQGTYGNLLVLRYEAVPNNGQVNFSFVPSSSTRECGDSAEPLCRHAVAGTTPQQDLGKFYRQSTNGTNARPRKNFGLRPKAQTALGW